MTNKYEVAWKKLRLYVEGMPFMLKLMPVPKEVIECADTSDPGTLIDSVSRVTFGHVLGLMEEQELNLGLSSDPRPKFLDVLSKASPTDTLKDLVDSMGKDAMPTHPHEVEAPDLESYANTMSAKERESTLLPATENAAWLNFDHMQALHSARALVVVPKKNGYPTIGCLFVSGERELMRLMDYAQDGHKMTYDSRTNDGTPGEN